MKFKAILVCLAILFAGIICISSAANAADAAPVQETKKTETPQDSNKSEAKAPVLPGKDGSEYWVIRSQAVNELIPFLTKKRTELKDKIQYFKDYMRTIGLDYAKDFFAADVKVPDDMRLRAQILGILDKVEEKNMEFPEKPLTWEELVTLAMKMELEEGYLPVQIDSQEELDQFKTILDRKEKFGMKIREEMNKYLQIAVRAWVYLGQINKQENFRLYVIDVNEKKKEELEAKRQTMLEEKNIRTKERREQEKQNVWQDRQDRLTYHYGYYY